MIALGGSTNAVLHLLAIAHEAKVDLSLDDFTRDRRPSSRARRPAAERPLPDVGADPNRRHSAAAEDACSTRGLLHGGCLTVTGRTVAENLASVRPYPADQDIVRPLANPIKADSHLAILFGNLAPGGAVAKISGKEGHALRRAAPAYSIRRNRRCARFSTAWSSRATWW